VPELDDSLKRAPHTYSKDKESLWGKLIGIFTPEIDLIKSVFTQIKSSKDIDLATGKTLDKIGGNVDQGRGKTSDQIYRSLIKIKIARNICEGTIDKLIEVIAVSMGIEFSEVGITEEWEILSGRGGVVSVFVPDYALNNLGMSPEQFTLLIDKVMPGGVGIGAFYEGTFAFSDDYEEPQEDSDEGFDAGELGGFYSASEGGDTLPL
jgi:hypothetical protein